jgi:glycosyltransferase involved in cell wall biosynthesis
MSIVIFGDMFTFPEGGAATNRIYSYSKGFTENKVNVHVISFLNEYRSTFDGIIDGINYHYPYRQSQRSKYFIIRRLHNITKFITTYRLIKKLNKNESIVAINLWTNLFSTHLFGWFLSRVTKSKLLIECSEHPLRYFQSNSIMKMTGNIKFWVESHLCDGILCISRYLVEIYRAKNIDEKKLFLVPCTVDPSRFAKTGESPVKSRYIGYFGSLTFSRDNIDMLIRAFASISPKYPEMDLVLGGICNDQEKNQIRELLEQLRVSHKTRILEYLSREEIIRYISHADILVMVRKDNLQAKASFPSKLAEYLATSNPVISVNVGEISDYIQDGRQAYLIEAGNTGMLSDKIGYVLNNYELALKTAQSGAELANTVFNYNKQAARILEYISSLQQN